MKKYLTIMALAGLTVAGAATAGTASAQDWHGGRGGYHEGGHRYYNNGYHGGRGYWHNGVWVNLGGYAPYYAPRPVAYYPAPAPYYAYPQQVAYYPAPQPYYAQPALGLSLHFR